MNELIERARAAAAHAYAPYSGVKIGAAVSASGNIYVGCNVENASYGLSVCAERNAIFAAIADGARKIDALAVWSDDVTPYPCGACRQVIAEFCSQCEIFVCGTQGVQKFDAAQLLPHGFQLTEVDK